ncbi:hypothetical protein KKG45_11595 [bacterium]|nr:hypothetical protein [bacterium]MBU1073879.1 hypothetical protein [bacterium]MBU1676797.1 hypothetical protein [bacterium]
MNLRTHVQEMVEHGKLDEIDMLLGVEPRAVRYLVSLTYRTEPEVRRVACRGVALAARYHPDLVQQVVRRLIWAMNDESGTNALTAPEVVKAIADERPEVLLPLVPDLARLAADEGLKDGLAGVLQTVAGSFPGAVGRGIQDSLNKRFRKNSKRGKKHGKCGCGQ